MQLTGEHSTSRTTELSPGRLAARPPDRPRAPATSGGGDLFPRMRGLSAHRPGPGFQGPGACRLAGAEPAPQRTTRRYRFAVSPARRGGSTAERCLRDRIRPRAGAARRARARRARWPARCHHGARACGHPRGSSAQPLPKCGQDLVAAPARTPTHLPTSPTTGPRAPLHIPRERPGGSNEEDGLQRATAVNKLAQEAS